MTVKIFNILFLYKFAFSFLHLLIIYIQNATKCKAIYKNIYYWTLIQLKEDKTKHNNEHTPKNTYIHNVLHYFDHYRCNLGQKSIINWKRTKNKTNSISFSFCFRLNNTLHCNNLWSEINVIIYIITIIQKYQKPWKFSKVFQNWG